MQKQNRERYYLTASHQLAQFVSMNPDGTYICRVGNGTKTLHPNFLTFVPAEKLNWFKQRG